MPRTLILNNKNVVSGTNNARYLYKFPNSVQFKDHQIAVASVNMYYSWFSITSDIGNNTFEYVWYNGDGDTITYGTGFKPFPSFSDPYVYNDSADQDTYTYLNMDGTYVFSDMWSLDSYIAGFTKTSTSEYNALECSQAGPYTATFTGNNYGNSAGDTLVYAICVNGSPEITTTTTGTGSFTISGTLNLEVGDLVYIMVKNTTTSLSQGQAKFVLGDRLDLEGTFSVNTITIPDGFYSIDDLNAYLQSQMVSNGHYLEDSVGDYVYYLELTTNASQYAVQFNSYPIPTALPSGCSNPASMTFPSTATTPQIIISSDNTFQDIIGFDAGTYPSSTQDSNYSHTSDYTPQVTPTQSLILSCSLLNNPYANPNTLLYSFAPTGTSFGSLISSSPNELVYVDIQDGVYSEFFIEFLDQNLSQLSILDNNLVVMLVVKQKGE